MIAPALDVPAAPPGFAAFSLMHVVVVVVAAMLLVPILVAGRAWRDAAPDRERRLRLTAAISIILLQVVNIVYWALPGQFDPAVSLPVHVCDLVPWVAAAALMLPAHRGRWTRSLAYFWGIGLSSWGFFWPVLEAGPETLRFWLFWATHLQIVGAGLYLAWVRPWRPDRRDLSIAVGAVVAYAILITPVNLALEADYGYVGPGAGPASLLGPWPWRVPIVLVGEAAIFGLLLLPWIRSPRDAAAE